MESYKYQFAKQTLAKWLADPDPPLVKYDYDYNRVFVEYPFCLDIEGKLHGQLLWDENSLKGTSANEFAPCDGSAPSYQQCVDAKLIPICIFDVAIQREGNLVYTFEIVHKHDITPKKWEHIDRIAQETSLIGVYGLSAEWVLSQLQRPRRLKTLWQRTWG